MSTSLRVWLTAIAEGFSTLAVEVIAIRLAIPVVGSSMTLTGVMLGVVLLALSAGYWRGGELSSRWDKDRVRRYLAANLLAGAIFYAAFTFLAEAWLLEKFLDWGLGLAPSIGLAAIALIAIPVFFVAQSVPMLAELTNDEGKAGKASGKVLFFSTLGSVIGGIVTPLWLFPWLGVAKTTWVVCGLLIFGSVLMATTRLARTQAVAMGLIAITSATLLGAQFQPDDEVVYSFDSEYNTVRVINEEADDGTIVRIMNMNGSRSSGVYADSGESAFPYIRMAGGILRSLPPADQSKLLAIGSAGFTWPRDAAALDAVTKIDTVDVDPSVKWVAERHFLGEPLSPKIRFFPQSARWALRNFRAAAERYDLTFLDAYSGRGIPDELLTVEFFRDIQSVSRRTLANIILDPKLKSAYSRNVLATFRSVYGHAYYVNVDGSDTGPTNFLIADWPFTGSLEWTANSGVLYTDDRNTADRDHTRMIWKSAD